MGGILPVLKVKKNTHKKHKVVFQLIYYKRTTMEDTDNSRVEENMEEECENNITAVNEPSDVDDADEEQTETPVTENNSNGQNNVDEEITAEEVVEEDMEAERPPPRLMITKMVRFIYFLYVCRRPYQSITTIKLFSEMMVHVTVANILSINPLTPPLFYIHA